MKPDRIPSLDGIRALSVALVFFAHAGWGDLIPGGFGVTVFFFLSGYLITTLLYREQKASGRISFSAFYLRRLFRLGPPLFATMAAATFLVLIGWARGDLDPGAYLSQILFFFNYWSLSSTATSVEGLDVLWSLSVEEHFYFIWPAVFVLVAAGRVQARHLVAALICILVWRFIRFYGFGSSFHAVYLSTDTRFDSILFGCLLALLSHSGAAERILSERLMWPAIILAAATLLACFVIRDEGFRATLRYSLQGAALLPLFHYAITRSGHPLFQWLECMPLRRIGLYSYSIYLSHFVVLRALEGAGFGSPSRAVIALVVSIAWAALLYEFLEKPLRAVRAKLMRSVVA